MEYRAAKPKKPPAPQLNRPRVRWTLDSKNWYKINFDGTVFQDDGRAGIRVITRDCHDLPAELLNFPLSWALNALKDDFPSLASFGLLIWDAQLFANGFNDIRFSHVRKDGNSIAHNLARHTCHVIGFSVWMEDVPLHSYVVYQMDLPVS
ncbi:hypothetical protein ACB092_12G111000 [Castanea dentata]